MIRSTSLDVPYQTVFTNGTHDAIADVPVEKGGAGKGFGPHELLEAAFATCLTMTVQMYAAKHDIPLRGTRCEVRIDRAVPNTVTLSYALAFDGPLTDEQSAQLRAAASKCPVARSLTGTILLQPLTLAVPKSEGLQ
ncbi:MAG TPA: OsmC family protein [Gemmataceae bacterium]|jgi:putative redox protein|nr:OsmC family protein [Gemmataceae bacterium]